MSDRKKDLTSIEDLGEYIHELESSEDFLSESTETPPEEESSGEFGSSFESDPFSEPGEFSSDSFEAAEPVEDPETTFEEPSFATDLSEVPELPPEPEISFDTPFFEEKSAPDPTPYVPEPSFKTPETFEEVRKFAENTSFTGMGAEGNPSFSVLLKNVRYTEDVEDIISLLREFKLLIDSEDQVRTRLSRGTLLIPRISEFAAIFLAHKLRRFDIEILLGFSDEIHPPKTHEESDKGLVSKHNLYQNQSHHFDFHADKVDIADVILSASPTLDGYQVVRYQGIGSEHKLIDGELVMDETSAEIPLLYKELAQKLRAHAVKAQANAVVGLNYQLTPLPSEFGMNHQKYRLTCTGNLVWVNRL